MSHCLASRVASTSPSPSRKQRGIVMFIALLVMVALSLAGIALIRSADTATVVSGNLAFKQAAVYAVDRSVEQAVKALFDPTADPSVSSPTIVNKDVDLAAENYFACVQAAGGGCLPPNAPIPEIPTVLTTSTLAKTLTRVASNDGADNVGYYVIERMCATAGAASSNCNLALGSLGADAGTQHYEGIVRPGGAFYRVTVRVEGPRNTVAYAQTILQ